MSKGNELREALLVTNNKGKMFLQIWASPDRNQTLKEFKYLKWAIRNQIRQKISQTRRFHAQSIEVINCSDFLQNFQGLVEGSGIQTFQQSDLVMAFIGYSIFLLKLISSFKIENKQFMRNVRLIRSVFEKGYYRELIPKWRSILKAFFKFSVYLSATLLTGMGTFSCLYFYLEERRKIQQLFTQISELIRRFQI